MRSWVEIHLLLTIPTLTMVDLLVRSWVEIMVQPRSIDQLESTSLWGRELKYFRAMMKYSVFRRPPCEVVSWNANWNMRLTPAVSRPPCEVVSWNAFMCWHPAIFFVSTSLWGRELKWLWEVCNSTCKSVDLLVRSWVEMYIVAIMLGKVSVDLLVRSWVEILT